MRVSSMAGLLAAAAASAPSLAQPCPADLGRPFGVLNIFDLTAYLDLYQADSPVADIAEPFGTLNFFDLAAFLDRYLAGCPLDSDGDRIADIHETGNGIYLGPNATGTDPFNPDTDGDGIIDGDEVFGTVDGLDLPAMGALPVIKDIFIECDWFEGFFIGRERNYRPTAASVARVVASFANAPVPNPAPNPDGIAIHLDYGQGGPFTGGNRIPGEPAFVVFGDQFYQYKADHFDPRRKGYFHYAVFASRHSGDTNRSSGIAEINGDDFMVTMVDYLSTNNQSNTIVHELGHNLGLRHGGFENRNYKPNYNSVMNYRHQFPGVDANGDSRGDGVLDYSRGLNFDLDESAVYEPDGVIGFPIDFDRDGLIDTVPYALNLNCSGTSTSPCGSNADGACADSSCSVLLDFNDWANINWSRLAATADRRPEQEIAECENAPD